METITPAATLATLIAHAAEAKILSKAVFSKPHNKAVSRVTLTLKRVKGEVMLQLETLRVADVADAAVNGKKPVQASHENLTVTDAPARLTTLTGDFDQINLMTTAGNCELRRSKNGKETLLGATPVQKAIAGGSDKTPVKITVGGNDKAKRRILTGAEPFLVELGVSDQSGRVHDKKQAKYRQINRFLELIRDVESHLPAEGTLNIADLCCGKSYLSFAVYHYFTAVRGRTVRMVGVDMKAEVMEECNTIARNLGMEGLAFVCGDVTLYEFPEGAQVHMVISLHACDIATDIVLNKATEWGAKVILSTPCCHRYLSDRVDMEALSFVTKHPYLKGKLCEILTEGIRLARLEANGYRVTALEMTDPDDTPKNTLLRAVKLAHFDKDSKEAKEKVTAYANLLKQIMGDAAEKYLEEIKL